MIFEPTDCTREEELANDRYSRTAARIIVDLDEPNYAALMTEHRGARSKARPVAACV